MTRRKAKLKLCTACERDYRRHSRVARFVPRWTCIKCGDVCCEHLCGFKDGDKATCSSCQIQEPKLSARTPMTRGGSRPGSGPKPRSGVAMDEMLRAPVTSAQLWWAQHVATHASLSVAEWMRMLVDEAVGKHRCGECAAAVTRARSGR